MVTYQTGLIARNQKYFQGKEWYNQRFDGCLNLLWMISEAEIRSEKRKMKGGNFTSHLCIFEDHKADWYIDWSDIRRVTDLFLKKANTVSHFGRRLIKQWEADEKTFARYLGELSGHKLRAVKDRELTGFYLRLTGLYEKTITSSSLIDGFALGSDEIIQSRINALLDERGIDKDRGSIFSVLTAPVHQSFINQAEISLLRIVAKVKAAGGAAALKRERFRKMLTAHASRYFWINNNYHDNHVLAAGHFIQEIKILLAGRTDAAREIKKIEDTPRRNLLAKRKLIRRLRPARSLKSLLEISEDFTYWQDERKRRTFLFTHYASLLIEEIGRRHGYSLAEMKYLARAEVAELLAGRRFSHRLLKERARLMIACQKGNHYEILSGARARAMIKSIFAVHDHSHIQDFRGLPAATGVVRGYAKIVKSVKEVGKVNPGDILVAVMTRPDYIMGIKKAAAIVTDEGGITCHAAIISRELGLPCVIGTKIGTKVLKDGDLIEVNANHGWVRKIK